MTDKKSTDARPFVMIELDGEKRKFRLTLNDMLELEERFKMSFSDEGFSKAFTEKPLQTLRTMLFLGLRHDMDGLTEEAVGDMIDMANFKDLMDSILKQAGLSSKNPTGPTREESESPSRGAKPLSSPVASD